MRMGPATMIAAPRVRCETTLVRGKGRLLAVGASRPFVLELDNVIAALDGSLLTVEAASKEPGGLAEVRLNRVTTYLTGPLLQLAARPAATDRVVGLSPLSVTATNCLFAPAAGPSGAGPAAAFVRFDRVDGATALEEKGLFTWAVGRDNFYAFPPSHVMLEANPENGADVMPQPTVDAARWLRWTREPPATPFGRVRFRAVPQAPFTTARPADFQVQAVDPPPREGDAVPDAGAGVDRFRQARVEPADLPGER
jgi:hypothetical protein